MGEPKFEELTDWFFSKQRGGVKLGLCVQKWENNTRPVIIMKKWRQVGKALWVPLHTQLFFSVDEFIELFHPNSGLMAKFIKELYENEDLIAVAEE